MKEDKALIVEDWKESILPLFDSSPSKLKPIFFSVEEYFAARTLIASRSFEIDSYHGFGVLKEECMEFLPFVVVTGCLLHNFLIKCGEPMLDDENLKCLKEDEELPVYNGEMNESGKGSRIRLPII